MKLRQLSDSFAIVELRDCTRQHGESFAGLLRRFAIPVTDLPPVSVLFAKTFWSFPREFSPLWAQNIPAN
jgi:hypothetical protein